MREIDRSKEHNKSVMNNLYDWAKLVASRATTLAHFELMRQIRVSDLEVHFDYLPCGRLLMLGQISDDDQQWSATNDLAWLLLEFYFGTELIEKKTKV